MDTKKFDLGKGYEAEVVTDLMTGDLRKLEDVTNASIVYETLKDRDGNETKRVTTLTPGYAQRYQDKLIEIAVKGITRDGKPLDGAPSVSWLTMPATCGQALDGAVSALLPDNDDPKGAKPATSSAAGTQENGRA